jgi:hypothetical protein
MIPDGKSDDVISHIIGNVFTVTYDATLPENSLLGGKTYNLKNGGTLVPE